MKLTKKAIKKFESAITAATVIMKNARDAGDTEKALRYSQERIAYGKALYFMGYDYYCEESGIAHIYKEDKFI